MTVFSFILFHWKFKLFLRFYISKMLGQGSNDLWSSVKQIFSSLFSRKTHSSKLQSALWTGAVSAWRMLKTRFSPSWMPEKEEEKLFANWDKIYEQIRVSKLAKGEVSKSPENPRELHQYNVMPILTKQHQTISKLQPSNWGL